MGACLISRAEFDIMIRTILEVFPHVTMWRGEFVPRWPTLALVCSTQEQHLNPFETRRNITHIIHERATTNLNQLDVLPYILYAGNIGLSRELFARAPVNTDDLPLIEYMAPKTQQRAESGHVSWLRSDELLRLFQQLFKEVPPENDPYLVKLSNKQIAFVKAGLQLFEVGVYVEMKRFGKAAPLYRKFLKTIPFNIFPGLALLNSE